MRKPRHRLFAPNFWRTVYAPNTPVLKLKPTAIRHLLAFGTISLASAQAVAAQPATAGKFVVAQKNSRHRKRPVSTVIAIATCMLASLAVVSYLQQDVRGPNIYLPTQIRFISSMMVSRSA
jgi:hypothetical protein